MCVHLCRAALLNKRKMCACEWDACGACSGALPLLLLQTCMFVYKHFAAGTMSHYTTTLHWFIDKAGSLTFRHQG